MLKERENKNEFKSLENAITPGVKAFRSVELFVSDLVAFGLTSQRFILAFLVLLCALQYCTNVNRRN